MAAMSPGAAAATAHRGAAAIDQAGETRSARVESLRAFAALAVLVGHVYAGALGFTNLFSPFSHRLGIGGGLGVYLFFVLSGFLLFRPWARQIHGGAGVDLRRYARNRALRILPLYYAILVVLLIVSPAAVDRGVWWRFALFIAPYSHGIGAWLDDPMWSLSVEMQFYLVLPVIGWVLVRLARGSLVRAGALLAGVGMASYVLRAISVHREGLTNDFLAGRYSLSTLFFFFVAGMLLALVSLAWGSRAPGWLRGPLASPWLWIAAAVAGYLVVCDDFNREWVLAVASFLLVGACVLPLRPAAIVRLADGRALALVGIISYSVYLWQAPVLYVTAGEHYRVGAPGAVNFVGAPRSFPALLAVTLPAVLAVAAASYWAIERPFLRLRRRWAASSPVVAVTDVPADAATGEAGGVAPELAAVGAGDRSRERVDGRQLSEQD